MILSSLHFDPSDSSLWERIVLAILEAKRLLLSGLLICGLLIWISQKTDERYNPHPWSLSAKQCEDILIFSTTDRVLVEHPNLPKIEILNERPIPWERIPQLIRNAACSCSNYYGFDIVFVVVKEEHEPGGKRKVAMFEIYTDGLNDYWEFDFYVSEPTTLNFTLSGMFEWFVALFSRSKKRAVLHEVERPISFLTVRKKLPAVAEIILKECGDLASILQIEASFRFPTEPPGSDLFKDNVWIEVRYEAGGEIKDIEIPATLLEPIIRRR